MTMTNRNRVRLSKLSLGLALALDAAPSFAQQTSASVGGRIVSADSAPVAGAQVTIVHEPSGTARTAVTGDYGRYTSRGLRVGGPYTITVVKDGVTEVREGVYLQLAETTSVDATLGQAGTCIVTDSLRQRIEMMVRDVRVYGGLLARQRREDLAGTEPGFMARWRKQTTG